MTDIIKVTNTSVCDFMTHGSKWIYSQQVLMIHLAKECPSICLFLKVINASRLLSAQRRTELHCSLRLQSPSPT